MSLVGPRPERPFFVEQFKVESPATTTVTACRWGSPASPRCTDCVVTRRSTSGPGSTTSTSRTGRCGATSSSCSRRSSAVIRNTLEPSGETGRSATSVLRVPLVDAGPRPSRATPTGAERSVADRLSGIHALHGEAPSVASADNPIEGHRSTGPLTAMTAHPLSDDSDAARRPSPSVPPPSPDSRAPLAARAPGGHASDRGGIARYTACLRAGLEAEHAAVALAGPAGVGDAGRELAVAALGSGRRAAWGRPASMPCGWPRWPRPPGRCCGP